jgi:ABC transporter DrrB family efflux protein
MSSQLGWAAHDGWVISRREFSHWARQPAQIILTLLFPVLIVVMFGYLFGGQMSLPGGGEYREFLMPGMFAMTMLFGLETTFVAVSTDATRGVTDRFRSMPMSASGVVIGRSIADMVTSVAGLAVMVACGLAIGWRWHSGTAEVLAALALLLLLRFALLWLGIYLGLRVRNPEFLVAIQILVWPIGFLSSAFIAPATMPGWLGTIAEWNPLSATVTAARELFGNPAVPTESWISANSVTMAIVWPVLIVAVFFPLSVRAYRRLGR